MPRTMLRIGALPPLQVSPATLVTVLLVAVLMFPSLQGPGLSAGQSALVALGLFGVVQLALTSTLWALLGLAGAVLLVGPVRLVLVGAMGRDLIRVLKLTGLGELAAAVGVFVGSWL